LYINSNILLLSSLPFMFWNIQGLSGPVVTHNSSYPFSATSYPFSATSNTGGYNYSNINNYPSNLSSNAEVFHPLGCPFTSEYLEYLDNFNLPITKGLLSKVKWENTTYTGIQDHKDLISLIKEDEIKRTIKESCIPLDELFLILLTLVYKIFYILNINSSLILLIIKYLILQFILIFSFSLIIIL
jgi:hypothetical protein